MRAAKLVEVQKIEVVEMENLKSKKIMKYWFRLKL